MDKFPYSSAPLRRVKGVQFGILDPEFMVWRCSQRWCGSISALCILQLAHQASITSTAFICSILQLDCVLEIVLLFKEPRCSWFAEQASSSQFPVGA